MDKQAPSVQHAQLLIDGRWVTGAEDFAVFDKFNGALVGRCERASKEQVDYRLSLVATGEQASGC